MYLMWIKWISTKSVFRLVLLPASVWKEKEQGDLTFLWVPSLLTTKTLKYIFELSVFTHLPSGNGTFDEKPPRHNLIQLHSLTVNYSVPNPEAKKLYELELGEKKD